MQQMASARTPMHLWIVGILSLLWNAFGCYDYFMTKTKGATYIESMMPGADGSAIMAYLESMPAWTTGAWALGVWGGLAGSLLLLARSRHAIAAFALSVVGVVITFGYMMFGTDMPASMKTGVSAAMPWVIFIIALFLLWYARGAQKQGLLR